MKKKKEKTRYGQIKARFKPVNRFEVEAFVPAPIRGSVETDLEQLKARLLEPLIDASATPKETEPLQRAANEAAGLAWFTPFPLLVFPALLEEKVYAAQRQEARQRQILKRTQGLLDKAVA